MTRASTSRIASLVLSAALALSVLPGCYKSEMEAQKTRADAAEKKAAELESQLATTKQQADTLRVPAQKFQAMSQNAKLGVYVNNQKIGTEELRWDETRGEFVRNGARVRSTSVVRFDNGKLADQMLKVGRESGKPLVEGMVKNSRPEGDWIWYNAEGRPTFKEVWKDGKLDGLYSATISKPKAAPKPKTPARPAAGATPGTTTRPAGATTPNAATPGATPAGTTAVPAGPNTLPTGETITWKAMSKGDRDARVRNTVATFAALPELIRE